MTIGGVFEEVPENSHSRYDVIVSMASAGRFMWEGSPTNMLGNDRYISYVKLHKGGESFSFGGTGAYVCEFLFPSGGTAKGRVKH